MKYIFLIITIILSVGCSSSANAHDPEKMADLASQLKDISAAVDGTLKFSSETYTDPQKLLLDALRNDKAKLEVFKDYQLKIVIQEKNAVLLLCEEETLLIEDAGCTAKSDLQHWKYDENQICEITLQSNQICGT
ncbi:hypothetical protein CWB58_04450 [Pseudoalteromonas sp. S201]|jgi:outer membrane lipoprotein-sorting protein|uniref:hypothetical protein n=1 Tax=unclassified Pseudoalteromonas TaxID=194690 RepID=UPI00110CA343|nr:MULTISPECIES: hypothetical protein [unclassified Pseudoalteromonas]MDN3485710.1 hypothetical protein [Pseudoalteromonas sp. APC 3224]TMS94401.1 hypothetical protein CWB58_04450 [Pseudoalteromonas sp. S201]|tara:strand:+ start:354 stop:758 length:405 start_codon:yes stop_codon:yes gene_type:complete